VVDRVEVQTPPTKVALAMFQVEPLQGMVAVTAVLVAVAIAFS
jgi:hypothetical protein